MTDIAGTTRDVLERTVSLGRVKLNMIDTAGVRTGDEIDKVEKIGITRSKERISTAELILAVFDISREFDESDRELCEELSRAQGYKVCVLNKQDLADKNKPVFDSSLLPDVFGKTVTVSADKDNLGAIEQLSSLVNALFTDEKISCGQDAIVSSARQHSSLLRARSYADTAIEAFRLGLPADAASSDIEMAIGAISELDGRAVSDTVVGDIFAKFCVGK